MRAFRVFLVLFVIALLASASLPAQAQGSAPDTPTYSLPGPYAVGRSSLVFEKGTEKALVLTAWYPALKPEAVQGSATLAVPEANKAPFLGEPGTAALDAGPDMSGAPYPLVVFSHCFGGFPSTYWYLGEHLASWGFVVLAPYHMGDESWNNMASTVRVFYPSIARRLLDVKRTIQYAETLTGTGGVLQGIIDTERIAVSGHSAGGITAYGAAGASFNWSVIEQYCTEISGDPACQNLPAQKQAMQGVIGTDSSLEGRWPAIWDSRVQAIIPMSGTTEPYGQEGLSKVTQPMMVVLGSADKDAPVQWIYPAYKQVSSTQKAQVVFEGAAHAVFADQIDRVWDTDQAVGLVNHFTTAFLLDMLKGDKEAHKALLSDAVKFPGIEYQTTLK